MDTINKNLHDKLYIPPALREELKGRDMCFLDIETTGLSAKYNKVILIGLLWTKDEESYVTQFLAESQDEEYDILVAFTEFIAKFDYLITYNGSSFDIPFLKKRLEFHKIDYNLDKFKHLDLLKLVRKHKSLLNLSDCKLKTVERSLNIFREDTISGKESISIYKDYVSTKDPLKKELLLKHNFEDVFYLPKLFSIYDMIDSVDSFSTKVRVREETISINISKSVLEFKDNSLQVGATTRQINMPTQIYYKDFYILNWNPSSGSLEIEFNYKSALLSTGESCNYIDLSEARLTLDDLDKESYSIPDDVLLLRVDEKIMYKNILILIKNIISNLE